MNFETILSQVGDEGRFQFWLIFLVLTPTSIFNALFDTTHLITGTPTFNCHIPSLDSVSSSIPSHFIPIPFPNDTEKKSCFRYDLPYERLQTSLLSNTSQLKSTQDMLEAMNITELSAVPIVACDRFVYDQKFYTETATTYFDFVCDKDWIKMYLIQVCIAGLPIMTPIISLISDRYGRRHTLLIVFLLAELSCATPLLFKTLPMLFITRFLTGAIINAYYQLPFVLTQEMVSARYRTLASFLSAIFYSFGAVLVPYLFKWTGNWIIPTWVTFLASLPYIIFYRFIPESPFWLISRGKFQKAYDQLASIAKVNGKPVPETLMEDIIALENENKAQNGKKFGSINDDACDVKEDTLFDLLLKPGLRYKTFGLTLVFIACTVSYVGISTLTMTEEANVQNEIVIVLAFIDIPALIFSWLLVDSRLGRRWADVLGLMICGLSFLVPVLFQVRSLSNPIAEWSVYIGKFGIAGCYMIVYQHASELFPTTLRNQGMGFCATIGSLFGILSSYFLRLAHYGVWLPLLIISITCITSAIFASFLPETLNEFLPERAENAAKFGQNMKYWSLANLPKQKEQPNNVEHK